MSSKDLFTGEEIIKVFDLWGPYEENWFNKLVQHGLLEDSQFGEFMQWIELNQE